MENLLKRRARVVAMQKDLDGSQVEYKKELALLQGACHHESVMEMDDNVMGRQRICVICGIEESYWTEDRGGYIKLNSPLAVQKVSSEEFYQYRKLQEIILVFVPYPKR